MKKGIIFASVIFGSTETARGASLVFPLKMIVTVSAADVGSWQTAKLLKINVVKIIQDLMY